jgi:hypothetical protein
MLEQTKNVIDALLAAGFARHDFSVRTHSARYGYMEPNVVLYCSHTRAVELTPAMLANGLAVEHLTIKGRVAYVHVVPGAARHSREQFRIRAMD